ncbi:MAG: hypothetical protein RBT74_06385 [Tenuifilaceae bacterium]|jgi:hypothetical protein|nr:hypothetical protein [Tenuifilaceae bacterium]
MVRKGIIKAIYLLVLVSLFSLVRISNAFCQDYGKLWIAGSNVQIIYSTLENYKNGVSLIGWTKVKVTIKCESCSPTDTWEIRMFARTNSLVYSGSETTVTNIDFDDFPIVVNTLGGVTGLTVNSPFELVEATPATSDGLVLIKGNNGMGLAPTDPPFEFEFTLSYSLPNMENKASENAMFFSVIDLLLISSE